MVGNNTPTGVRIHLCMFIIGCVHDESAPTDGRVIWLKFIIAHTWSADVFTRAP